MLALGVLISLVFERDLSDPMDVPARIAMVGDVVLLSACLEAFRAIWTALGQINHHAPSPG